MKLRDYQQEAIENAYSNLLLNKKALIVLPTGAGKTITATFLIKKLNVRTLILSHTKEIVRQTQDTLNRFIPEGNHVSMSIQKALRRTESLKKENFGCIIIDECHRAAAISYLKIIDSLVNENVFLLGITATPFRSDQQSIAEIFGTPCYKLTIIDLIQKEYLVDYKGYRVKTNITLKGISTKNGDFIGSKLASVINVKNRNELIVKEFSNITPNKQTIAFCANLKHCEDLKKEFWKNKIPAEVISGKISKQKREEILEDFRDGIIQVLINCNVLTEGYDEPSIECILMCRPTMSKTLYIQMIGRGSRNFEDKKYCTVIEFTDNHYDVCSLEDILEAYQPLNLKRKDGELLTDYYQRIPEVYEEGKDTIIEEYEFIAPNPLIKEASEWQKQFLTENGINFNEPLTEQYANQLIGEIYG